MWTSVETNGLKLSWLAYLLTTGLWNVWIDVHACMARRGRTRDIRRFMRGTTDRNRSYCQTRNHGNLPQSPTLIYSDWLATWIHVTRVWMNSPLQLVGQAPQSEESWCWMVFVQSGFCQAWFLEAQPPSKAFPKSVCPHRLAAFSPNKRVVGVKCDASLVSPLIYKAIRGRQIITLPSLGSKTRLGWLSMDLVPGEWNSWQAESTWCCFGVGLRGMSLALGCFQATHKKSRELPVWPWAPVLVCLLRAVFDVDKSRIVLTLSSAGGGKGGGVILWKGCAAAQLCAGAVNSWRTAAQANGQSLKHCTSLISLDWSALLGGEGVSAPHRLTLINIDLV